MAKFQCHDCLKVFDRPGTCKECGTALDKNCPVCGEEVHRCICTEETERPDRRKH